MLKATAVFSLTQIFQELWSSNHGLLMAHFVLQASSRAISVASCVASSRFPWRPGAQLIKPITPLLFLSFSVFNAYCSSFHSLPTMHSIPPPVSFQLPLSVSIFAETSCSCLVSPVPVFDLLLLVQLEGILWKSNQIISFF